MTLVADQWCPLNCVPNSQQPGYAIEIAKEIYEPLGHTVIYSNLSWDRAIKEVKSGRHTGIIAATPFDLPQGFFPNEALGSYSNYFFVRGGFDWAYTNIESLTQIKLGVAQGYDYGKALNTYIKDNPKFVTRIGGNQIPLRGLRMLIEGRIDVFLEDKNVIHYMAKKHNLNRQIKIAGQEGTPTKIYIGFSPKLTNSRKYAQLMSKGIKELRSSGRLQTILNKYGLQDWKTPILTE